MNIFGNKYSECEPENIGILRVSPYFDKNTIFHSLVIIFILYNKSPLLYLTLCDPMDCSPPGSSVHGDSPGKNTGVGCHDLRRSSQSRKR